MHVCYNGCYFVFYMYQQYTMPYNVKKKYLLVHDASNYPTAMLNIMAPCYVILSNLSEHMLFYCSTFFFFLQKKGEKKNSLSIYFILSDTVWS